jgi:hypothetical protein
VTSSAGLDGRQAGAGGRVPGICATLQKTLGFLQVPPKLQRQFGVGARIPGFCGTLGEVLGT